MRRRNFVAGLVAAGFVVSLNSAPLAQDGLKPSFKMIFGKGKSAVTLRLYTTNPERSVSILLRDSKGDQWLSVRISAGLLKVLRSAAEARAFTLTAGDETIDVKMNPSSDGGSYRYGIGDKTLTGNFGVDPEMPATTRGIISAIGNAIGSAISNLGQKLEKLGDLISVLTSGNFTIVMESAGGRNEISVVPGNATNGFIAEGPCDSNPMMMC